MVGRESEMAISDELQLLAHPLETISANQQPAARIAEIVREKKVDRVVAGVPRQMNGQIGSAATEVLILWKSYVRFSPARS